MPGSFSGAATQLRLGQLLWPFSKTIAQLEERLGVRLLLRSTHGLTPTEEGGISMSEKRVHRGSGRSRGRCAWWATTTPVARVFPRVFAFSIQAEQSIVVDPKSPGGINSPHGLILFDGVCILCSRGCRFVSKRDRRGYFRFVPIQLAEGRPLAEQLGIDPDRPDSFAFVANGQAYVKSEAALRIARELPRWQWTWVFHFIPRVIRDAIYDLVARNRYRWFGRRDACILPNLDRSWSS